MKKKKINEVTLTDGGALLGGMYSNRVFSIKQKSLDDLSRYKKDSYTTPELPKVGDVVTGQNNKGQKATGEILRLMNDDKGELEFAVILDDKSQKEFQILANTIVIEDTNETYKMNFQYKNIMSLDDFKRNSI